MAENAVQQDNNVVVDKATSSWSDLWKKEDYWAIWLGFLILTVGAIIFFNNKPADMEAKFAKQNAIMTEEAARAPFKTVAWYDAQTAKEKIKAKNQPIGKAIKGFMAKPKSGPPTRWTLLSRLRNRLMRKMLQPCLSMKKQKPLLLPPRLPL